MSYHAQKEGEALAALQTIRQGLAEKDARLRLRKYGPNEIQEVSHISPWKIFFEQFNSIVVWILLAATAFSVVVGETLDAVVIASILVLNAALGFFQEYRAEKAIEALKKMSALRATVLRKGKALLIDAKDLVPGDILLLKEGDKIPADARLLEVYDFETQEASLTGESTPISKAVAPLPEKTAVADRTNMVFSSTIAVRGKALAVVTGTGMQTQLGKIATLIQQAKPKPTPLQIKLAMLGKRLGTLTILITLIVFLTGLYYGGDFRETLLASIALAVAAIPEGLPAIVTISLALGVKRMLKRNALIRKLPSVETLGSTTVICTDKTGTLTMNEMTVRKIWVSDTLVDVTGEGYGPQGTFSSQPKGLDWLLTIGALCNDAQLDNGKVLGDPTEGCLIVSAAKHGLKKAELDATSPRLDEIPFSAERKRMTTIHVLNKKRYALVKGAPDVLLHHCTRIEKNGYLQRLTPKEKARILAVTNTLASQALRLLGFAYKPLHKEKKDEYETGLIFLGLQGMIDPPRKAAKAAIATCEQAGIRVVVITGDHELTARAIAKELGIDGGVMTGKDLDQYPAQLEKRIDQVAVFARVNPSHKTAIIEALRTKGHIVAMTGDGVNDAPALKNADIGIAMGITGTDVAKEASHMVLTDDNFASIVNAVEEGRGIYDNIKKFVNYLLSSNVGEVLTIFVASLLGWPLPLIAVQLLWLNLVTDGLPALALGLDPSSPDVMRRPPRNPKERILSPTMLWVVVLIGILVAAGALSAFRYGLQESVDKARTLAFTALVVLEIVRIQMVRGQYKVRLLSNRYLHLALGLSLALQLAVIYTPLRHLFETVPLSLLDWGYLLGLGAGLALFGMLLTKGITIVTHARD